VLDPTARSIVLSLFAPEEHELEQRYGTNPVVNVHAAITEARELLAPSATTDIAPATSRDAVAIVFGEYELDLGLCELRHRGTRVHVEPQVFDVLAYLAIRRGSLVTKEELLDNVWGDRFVSESTLTTRIKAARRATGDNGEQQSVIRTVRGRGFTFVATVR
jgi:DNA-binding winged helix-turn-helix (wHTH) protein